MQHRISCAEVILRLDDFLDRALGPAELELVQEHLLECVKCAEKYSFEASVLEGVRERLGRIAVPEALLSGIRARLERDGTGPVSP
jgi:anti-sigma factor (TIGR02949 family)